MQEPKNLSFMCPVYNEIENIEHCVKGAMEIGQMLGIDYEIVVVDDASTDGCGVFYKERDKWPDARTA
jgi:glycosyltransferase involved in cell wall biosynthesis